MMTNRRAHHGQTYAEALFLFVVTLTKSIKKLERCSSSIALKMLSSRKDHTKLGRALCSATTAKTLAMSGSTASNPRDVCDAMMATCIGNVLILRMQNLRRVAAIAPW
jgi:hypothetical protein